jgi:DNA-binding NtrC family response regulator
LLHLLVFKHWTARADFIARQVRAGVQSNAVRPGVYWSSLQARDEVMPDRPVVLLVDDEYLVVMMLRDLFNDAGFATLEAPNASDAIGLLRARPDIRAVVSDIEMRGELNGVDLAWHVDREFPDKVVILMSGRTQPSPGELPPGVTFHMKPVEIDDLVGEVGKKLSKRLERGRLALGPDINRLSNNVRPEEG